MIKKILYSPFLQNLIFYISYFMISLLCYSTRLTVIGTDEIREREENKDGGLILLWHENLLMPIFACKNIGIYNMIALSRDGELIARFSEKYGFNMVRGSSRRGGAAALINAISTVKQGHIVAITPDGPIGPKHKIHKGALAIMQKTGAKFTCCGAAMKPQIEFKKSWDQHKIPTLFSKVVVYFSPFESIPEGLSDLEYHDFIRDKINQANQIAHDKLFGKDK